MNRDAEQISEQQRSSETDDSNVVYFPRRERARGLEGDASDVGTPEDHREGPLIVYRPDGTLKSEWWFGADGAHRIDGIPERRQDAQSGHVVGQDPARQAGRDPAQKPLLGLREEEAGLARGLDRLGLVLPHGRNLPRTAVRFPAPAPGGALLISETSDDPLSQGAAGAVLAVYCAAVIAIGGALFARRDITD